MAKDKSFEWRMEGMIYALNVAKKQGIAALESEIRKRGITKAPMKFTQKQLDEFWGYFTQNIYVNMIATMFYSIHEAFGFGKQRLHKLKAEFDKHVVNAMSLDWLGQHYVKLEDYAIELNEKYDLGIDVARIAAIQDVNEKSSSIVGTCETSRIIEELKTAGYKEAAAFLEKKMK